jgi:beta-phosphoglucomutase-like phosphatase (HAD superfamily)
MTGLPGETVDRLQVLLCDADGNLFPSEEPAFVASAEVTNSFLARLGVPRRYAAEELRLATTGMNFRSTARALAAEHGVGEVSDLEDWVQEEKRVVTSHLSSTLVPDGQVLAPLGALEEHLLLAAVSSSALARLAGCFTATGLDALIPAERRFSAEDSLRTPTSKPDPAIYRHSCAQLGIAPDAGLAVEDSVPGARSAIAAGCPTVGNLVFVPPAERAQRADALREAGVAAVVSSWSELADLLLPALRRRASAAGPNPTGASR